MNTDGDREFLHNSSVIARAIVFIKKQNGYTVSFIVCDLRTNKKKKPQSCRLNSLEDWTPTQTLNCPNLALNVAKNHWVTESTRLSCNITCQPVVRVTVNMPIFFFVTCPCIDVSRTFLKYT